MPRLQRGWKVPISARRRLTSLKPSKREQAAEPATTFRVGWDEDALLFEIVCNEPEIDKLVASPSVHGGDSVAVYLETPQHRYYHIEVNPDGVVVDGNPGPNWESLADVKTERGPDFWKVLLRIPTVGLEEANSDPHHRVSGSKPTSEAPWYF